MTVPLKVYAVAMLLAVGTGGCRDDTTAPRTNLRSVTSGAQSLIDDLEPPVLVSLSFTPTSIDVSDADAQVVVTAQIKDDLAGVKEFQYIQFRAPTTAQYQFALLRRSEGTALDGTYVGTITVPRFSDAGDWYIHRIELTDEVGNWDGIYTEALNARGINTILQVQSIEDVQPPTLVSLSFAPASIDVSLADVEVQVTAQITDDRAGARDLQYIQFRAPTTSQYTFALLKRTSGSASDGTYTGTFIIPRSSEGGDWRINRIELTDVLGNYQGLNTDALQALGFNTILQVTSVQDIQAPKLVSLSFTPTEVNVSASDAEVEITARITDNLTGAKEFQYIQFVAPSTTQYRFALLKRTSGTPNDGIYTGTLIMPKFSEGGAWHIDRVELTDVMGNWSGLYTETLRSMGFNTILKVIGDVPDVTAPETQIDASIDLNGDGTSMRFLFSGVDDVGVVGFRCNLDGAAYASCASGVTYSDLPPGSHVFLVSAIDAAGNVDASPASFNWTVAAPVPTVADLIAAVRAMGLPTGVTNSLIAPLKHIERKDKDACGKLRVFIKHVNAKARNGQLSASQAGQLLSMANAIVVSLSCKGEDEDENEDNDVNLS